MDKVLKEGASKVLREVEASSSISISLARFSLGTCPSTDLGWVKYGWTDVCGRLVMSDSLWPHGLQPTRLLCPWNLPGKSFEVGCHSLPQKISPTQGLNPGILHCRQILYHCATWNSVNSIELPFWLEQENPTMDTVFDWTLCCSHCRKRGGDIVR